MHFTSALSALFLASLAIAVPVPQDPAAAKGTTGTEVTVATTTIGEAELNKEQLLTYTFPESWPEGSGEWVKTNLTYAAFGIRFKKGSAAVKHKPKACFDHCLALSSEETTMNAFRITVTGACNCLEITQNKEDKKFFWKQSTLPIYLKKGFTPQDVGDVDATAPQTGDAGKSGGSATTTA